jgi:hypothetical protein
MSKRMKRRKLRQAIALIILLAGAGEASAQPSQPSVDRKVTTCAHTDAAEVTLRHFVKDNTIENLDHAARAIIVSANPVWTRWAAALNCGRNCRCSED